VSGFRSGTNETRVLNHCLRTLVLMKSRILVIGNFLAERRQGSRQVCEDLSLRLESSGWTVITTSHKAGRFSRLLDTLRTIWKQRNSYSVAQVDVFSGKAFFMAESACWALRKLDKPVVLPLHGGAMPVFAHRWATGSGGCSSQPMPLLCPQSISLSLIIGQRNDEKKVV
jgi:hypothetical protein